ncbi:hypothetical protein J6590_021406 [Homalodisca vitripennis]|nr:hypothetical protein J6590_021406 [Homalodisca vitripennis]
MKVSGDVPLFQHSRKMLFVPQDTKFVAPLNRIVKGEPMVTGPGEKGPLQMHWTNLVCPPPKFDAVTSLPQLQPLSTSVPKLRVVSPEALGVKEAVKVFSSPKLHMVSASIPPKLKVMSSKVNISGFDDYTSSSEINVRNKPMRKNSSLAKLLGLSNGTKMNDKSCHESVTKSTLPKFEFQKTENKFVSYKFLPSDSSGLDNGGVNESPDKSNISVGLKTNSFLRTRLVKSQEFINKKNRLFIRPKGHFEELDSCKKEQAKVNKPLWKPVSMDGIRVLTKDHKKGVELSLKGKKVFRLIGNNNFKKLMDKRRQIKSSNKLSSQLVNAAQKFQMLNDIQSSSIVVLNPYEKLNKSGKLEMKETKLSPSVRKKVKLYKCATCQLSYLTLVNLQIHLATHTNHNSSGLSKDCSSKDLDIEFIGQFPRKKEDQYFDAEKSGKNICQSSKVLKKVVSKQISNGKTNKIPERFQEENACIPSSNPLKNTLKRPNEFTKSQNCIFDNETKNQLPLRRFLLKRNRPNLQGRKQKYQDLIYSQAPKKQETVRLKKESPNITEKKPVEENKLPIKGSNKREMYSLREKRRISYKPLKNNIELIKKSGKRHSERLFMKLIEKFKDDPLLTKYPVVMLSRLNINPQENIKKIAGPCNKK